MISKNIRKIIYWRWYNKFNYFSYIPNVTKNCQATDTRLCKL